MLYAVVTVVFAAAGEFTSLVNSREFLSALIIFITPCLEIVVRPLRTPAFVRHIVVIFECSLTRTFGPHVLIPFQTLILARFEDAFIAMILAAAGVFIWQFAT